MTQKNIFSQYKSTLFFILKFLGIYLLLAFIYQLYLSGYHDKTDGITLFVGKTVSQYFLLTGTDAQTIPLEAESGLKLIINGNYLARIVEGCTALSVIIMFIAFIISFGNFSKKSIVFAILGSIGIFIFNIFRIISLTYLISYLPQYQDFAHRIIFPAMIYGFVVFLWIIFVKKYGYEK
jgi:exosortase family protein XrtF